MQYESVEVIRLTEELVAIESTNVGTYEGEISTFIYDWMQKNTHVEVERQEFLPGRFNVIATLKGKKAHPNLIYIAHMDTVPVGGGWTVDPFKCTLDGNKLYGRGTCDMKAGLACAMIAFREVCRYCEEKQIVPAYDFVFIASGDEEDVMRGADAIVARGIADKESWVLDTEPSSALLNTEDSVITMAHKGKTWFELEVMGKAAHGSMPYNGSNAIIAMAQIILEIENRLAAYSADPVLGVPTACYGTIQGGSNINVVADNCKIQIDMRLAPPLTTEGSIQLVEEAIAAGTAKVPGTSGICKVLAKRPYVQQNDDSFLLKELQESVKEVTGIYARVLPFTGYTDSGVIDGSTGCGNGMSYGARGKNYHQPDEWVNCDSVIENLEVVTKLAFRILTEKK